MDMLFAITTISRCVFIGEVILDQIAIAVGGGGTVVLETQVCQAADGGVVVTQGGGPPP